MKLLGLQAIFVVALFLTSCVASRTQPRIDSDDSADTAIKELRQLMFSSEQFVKLHAAECLLSLDENADVFDTFKDEEQRFGDLPKYRIVVWRVLARSAPTEAERNRWTRKIADAFLDEQGPDRLHAIESLAKLSYVIPVNERTTFVEAAAGTEQGQALFALWVLAQNGETNTHIKRIAAYLRSDDMIARLRAGYILRHFRDVPPPVCELLFAATDREAVDNLAYPYLASSAFVVAQRKDMLNMSHKYRHNMISAADSTIPAHRAAIAQGFAAAGGCSDLPFLMKTSNDTDKDTRVFANYAIAKIIRQ